MSTITLPYDTTVVQLGRNARFGELQIETSRFAPEVHQHIYEYGLRQLINDAIVNRDEDTDVLTKARKRLDRLYGTVPMIDVQAYAQWLSK